MLCPMKYQLVIFDCDGVLVDSERLVSRIEARLLPGLGLSIDAGQARVMFKGKTVAEVVVAIERELGRSLPAAWVYEWAMATAHGFVRELREVQGVRALVEALATAGVQTCVASQSLLPRVLLSLSITGLDRLFAERIYTASMVARGKPAPDLFLHAAQRLAVAPAACAVIEDSASGVLAGRAAGMTVFGYAADEDAETLAAAGALVFESMQELPALLGLGRGVLEGSRDV
jgi:HAD superfamily hydrolase (TIGR01509 family)